MDNWITNRKPDKDGYYIVTLDADVCNNNESFVTIGEFKHGKWIDDIKYGYKCVLAWMPFPEVYKKEEE